MLALVTLLVTTSGTGLAIGGPRHLLVESDPPLSNPVIPLQPEDVARAVAKRGVRVAAVRRPQVHDTRKQGLVPFLQGGPPGECSAYVDDGANRWAAAPLPDVAHLYRLMVEGTKLDVTVYHAVQE